VTLAGECHILCLFPQIKLLIPPKVVPPQRLHNKSIALANKSDTPVTAGVSIYKPTISRSIQHRSTHKTWVSSSLLDHKPINVADDANLKTIIQGTHFSCVCIMSYTKTQIGNEMADGTVKVVLFHHSRQQLKERVHLSLCYDSLRSVGYH
jgi:hypothetical protein